jgi:lycopene beta-cyclase
VSLNSDLADADLQTYARTVLGIPEYRIVAREGGISPLTDYDFPRRPSPHVLRIGTAGGRVKPSSGYAFTRIQQDSAAIVRSLGRHDHPFDLPADSAYYRLCDSLLLDLMQHRPNLLPGIFRALFQNNPIERVLRFLDEAASPAENARLIASLPPQPFLRALGSIPGRASLAALHSLRSAGS